MTLQMAKVQEDFHGFGKPSCNIEGSGKLSFSRDAARSDNLRKSPLNNDHCDISPENSSDGPTGYWFHEKKYQRYWQHYCQLQQWQQLQQVAYWRAKAVSMEYENHYLQQHLASLYMGRSPPEPPSFQQGHPYDFPMQPTPVNTYQTMGHGAPAQKQADCNSPQVKVQSRKKGRRGSIGVDRSDLSAVSLEMEITEDMLAFFEQTARHRLELKKERRETEGTHSQSSSCTSSKASKRSRNRKNKSHWKQGPKEQAGFRRRTEMRELYGAAAPMIHGMETAMQLSFDRNCDLKQPKHWPNIPLKL